MNILVAQIISILAIIAITSSVQFKKKQHMMAMASLSHLLYSIQYIILGAYSAAYMDTVAIVRNLLFHKYNETKTAAPPLLTAFIIVVTIIIGLTTYDGFLSIIPVAIAIAYTVSASFKDPKIYKTTFGLCAIIWVFYNFKFKAYICVIGNIAEFISTIIALIRDYKNKKKYLF